MTIKLISIDSNHISTRTKLENLDDIFNQGQKIATFCQLGSSWKIEVLQPGLARLGTFIALAPLRWEIPAQTHL